MNDGLRPYTNYKESGLPWLGSIPAHWDVRRNGRLFAQRNETGFGDLPILEVSLKTGVRVRDMENLKRKQVMSDREKYKRAVKGDVAYNMMRLWQGAVGVAPVDGLVSPAYVVARPYAGTDTRYFSYLFRTDAYMAEIDGYSRGIVKDRNRLYWDDFKRMPSCYPPLVEQAAISNYLDANEILVRKFIRNRRRLMDVLIEQKQVITNRLLTRGFTSDGNLKETGFPWLGAIPKHWVVKRLKYVMHSVDLRSATGTEVLLSMRKHHGLVPYHEHFSKPPQAASLKGFKLVCPGQIVINRMQAGFGLIFASQYNGLVSPDFGVFQPTGEIVSEYLGELFRSRSIRAKFHAESTGLGTGKSGFMRLYDPTVGTIHIAFPPTVDEQQQILRCLTEETKELAEAVRKADSETLLAREYFTRLITDVVTGKLDVRHLAPSLGNLEEELAGIEADESLDDESVEEDADLVEESSDADD